MEAERVERGCERDRESRFQALIEASESTQTYTRVGYVNVHTYTGYVFALQLYY